MPTTANPRSVPRSRKVAVVPEQRPPDVPTTFVVTKLDSRIMSGKRGVQLPPLMNKGQIRPEQVTNAQFRLVEPKPSPQPLSDEQFNALIKRLVKCFMSEVAITKRLRKMTAGRYDAPANVELIRHLETLRHNYESERSGLVVTLSMDSRFVFQSPSTSSDSMPIGLTKKPNAIDLHSKSKVQVPSAATPRTRVFRPFSKNRKTRESQPAKPPNVPVICNHITTPVGLSQKLKGKLNQMQKKPEVSKPEEAKSIADKTGTALPKPHCDSQNSMVTANGDTDTGPLQSSSSSDIFYDFTLDMGDF